MTRAALPDRLRVGSPAVPVDDAFVAVLAAHAAASRPTAPARRVRPRLAVVLVAAAVAVTTLGAAWAAREPATRPPAPATHERRVAPDPVPPPAHPRPTRPTTGEAASDHAAPTGRHRRPAGRPTGAVTAPAGPAAQPRSTSPVAPPTRHTHEADEPRHHADDPTRDRSADDDRQPTGPSGDRTGEGSDDGTDDGTDDGSDGSSDGSADVTEPGDGTESTDRTPDATDTARPDVSTAGED
jgi:hypothetical protein